MSSAFQPFRSLRFWIVVMIPVIFILMSLYLMKVFQDKRDQVEVNVELVNRFNELETEFQEIQYALPIYNETAAISPDEVWKYNIRLEKIFTKIDSLPFFINQGRLSGFQEKIKMMDSLTHVMNRIQVRLLSQPMEIQEKIKTETMVKEVTISIIGIIKSAVNDARKEMVLLSDQLNSLWNWLFYLLISACFLAIFVIVFFVLYRKQRFDKGEVQLSLIKSEERNRALLNAIPDLIFSISEDGVYLDFKPSTGIQPVISPDEFLGKRVGDFFTPELTKELTTRIKRAIETGEIQYYEYQLPLNGVIHDYEARIVKSGVDEVISMIRDITERKKIEEDLKVSKERYALAVNAADVGVWDWDLKTNALYVDPNLKKMLGYDDHEIQNHIESWSSHFHPDDKEPFNVAASLHLQGNTPAFNLEHRMIHRDGSIVWFYTQGKAIVDESGKPYRMAGTKANITLVKKAQEAVQRSDEQLRKITDSVPALISYIDTDYKYRFNNKAYEWVFGISRDELAGMHVKNLIGKESFDTVKEHLDKALSGTPVRFSHYLKKKDGTPAYLNVSYIPDKDAKGKVKGVFANSVEITDLKKAEEKLSESEARLRSIIENINDVIITIDKKGSVLSINKVGFGFTMEQVVGKNIFSFLSATEKNKIKDGVLEIFNTFMPYNYDVNFEGADGKKVWYSCIASPIIKGDKVDSVIMVCRDVTEEKLADEAVMNAMIKGQDNERKRIAEELHDSLGQVLSSLGMNLNALESKIKENRLRNSEEQIINMKVLLTHAINEVRTISHALMPDVLDEFGLVTAIENLAGKLESTKILKLSVEAVNMERRLGKNVEMALYRITQELVNNVIKHSKAEQASIQLIHHGDSIVLMVEDDGVGFDNKNGNEGIGLKNILSRTKLLKGDMIVDSSFGKGTIITVEIPLNGLNGSLN